MRTSKWSRKKLFTFSLITLVLIFLLLEVIFRIVFAIEYKGYHTSVYVQGNSLQMGDSALVFRNRPFYLDYYKRFQFNEEGMRAMPGDVFMPQKKPGDFWVFLFGGSAIEGMGANKDGEWLDISGVPDHKADETIAAHLQRILQQRMPGRNVRIFNAANSGYALWQSMERYKLLSAKYQMDYVISLDGENEMLVAAQDSLRELTAKKWKENPLFHFPLNIVIPITARSAFVNKIKQSLFHVKFSARLRRNEKEHYPARKRWANQEAGELNISSSPQTAQATELFYRSLEQFDSLLTVRRQAHLLYIQPHLMFRDTARMNLTEKALYNYYAATQNAAAVNTFKLAIQLDDRPLLPRVKRLSPAHSWNFQVFVDYCHFTAQANEAIARLMADDIMKDY